MSSSAKNRAKLKYPKVTLNSFKDLAFLKEHQRGLRQLDELERHHIKPHQVRIKDD